MNKEVILTSARTISLSLPPGASPRDLQIACTLFCGLRQLGKQVRIEGTKSDTLLFPAEAIREEEKKTFALIVKDIAPRISRVRYEKDQKDLKLYFSLSDGVLDEKNVHLVPIFSSDLTLIVGHSPLRDNGTTSSESGPVLMDALEAKEMVLQRFSPQEKRLFEYTGALFAQSEKLSGIPLYIGTFSRGDFEAQDTTPQTMPATIQYLIRCIGSHYSYLLLYEEKPQKNRGLLWSPSPEIRAKINQSFPAQQKEQWLLFPIAQSDLGQAKTHLIQILSSL